MAQPLAPTTTFTPAPIYEIVDLMSGSLVGAYPDELQAIRALLQTHSEGGDDAIRILALGVDDPSGRTDGTLLAAGSDLVERVRRYFGDLSAAT